MTRDVRVIIIGKEDFFLLCYVLCQRYHVPADLQKDVQAALRTFLVLFLSKYALIISLSSVKRLCFDGLVKEHPNLTNLTRCKNNSFRV